MVDARRIEPTDTTAIEAAHRVVYAARLALAEAQTRYTRHEVGKSDVTAAEVRLSRALAELDAVSQWRHARLVPDPDSPHAWL